MPSLAKVARQWHWTVRSLSPKARAMLRSVNPSAASSATSRSRAVSSAPMRRGSARPRQLERGAPVLLPHSSTVGRPHRPCRPLAARAPRARADRAPQGRLRPAVRASCTLCGSVARSEEAVVQGAIRSHERRIAHTVVVHHPLNAQYLLGRSEARYPQCQSKPGIQRRQRIHGTIEDCIVRLCGARSARRERRTLPLPGPARIVARPNERQLEQRPDPSTSARGACRRA